MFRFFHNLLVFVVQIGAGEDRHTDHVIIMWSDSPSSVTVTSCSLLLIPAMMTSSVPPSWCVGSDTNCFMLKDSSKFCNLMASGSASLSRCILILLMIVTGTRNIVRNTKYDVNSLKKAGDRFRSRLINFGEYDGCSFGDNTATQMFECFGTWPLLQRSKLTFATVTLLLRLLQPHHGWHSPICLY